MQCRVLAIFVSLLVAGAAAKTAPTHAFLAHDQSKERSFGRRVRRGVEILEPWQDGGRAVASRHAEAQLKAHAGVVTPVAYRQALEEIVNVASSRFIGTSGNTKAAALVRQRLQGLGFQVMEQHFPYDSTPYGVLHISTSGNIIAVLEGSDLAHEVVIFGAHYDSVNWQNTNGAAPGADDDGSGLASLFMVAEAVAKSGQQRRTVVLVAFQAEEVGLMGSEAFVRDELPRLGTPVATFIADQVAYRGRPQHSNRAIFETKGRSNENVALVDTLARQAQSDGGLSGFEVNYHGFGSDHIPFLDAGYPAVLLIERDNLYYADHWGHTAQDTLDRTDAAFGSSMARLAARAVLAVASPA